MSICTLGAMPRYTSFPPKSAPGNGYPHNEAHTKKILESMWGDIIHLEAFICATTSLVFDERLEYSPTTTVPKRLPDRTFCAKSRTISDLRRINLGIDTDDFFPIWLPGIKDIAERINRMKRHNPGIPVRICKRDISNAFKRAPLRPDFISIFCHRFEACASALDQDATIGRLALPFGFAASHALFALCADAIQRVRRSYRANDGSWSVWEQFHAELFVGDAIFAESEMGNVLQETIA